MTSTCRARGAIAQGWPDEQVDEEAHDDADPRVEHPGDEHGAVVAVAGREHDERGRGRRRRLGAQAAHGARDQADQDDDPE
jgi:hypothetical protein